MADTLSLSVNEIKNRSIIGAKWLLVTNGLGMPAAALIALMLGRAGPTVLGTYALAQMLIGVITTFVLYGGEPVLSVFMPKISDAEARGRFVFSYMLILLAMMAASLSLFWLFPNIFQFVLQQEFDMRGYLWFVSLAILVVATETLVNTGTGLMLIQTTAVARQMMRLMLLPIVAIMFFFKRDTLVDNSLPYILGGFAAGYILAMIICVISLVRDQRFKLRPGWFLPPGFWAFSFTTMMATVFTFLYGNIDRMAVLAISDLKGLGMYQAVLSINALLERFLLILRPSITPTFANLLGANHQDVFNRAFSILGRWTTVPITLMSLVTMAFSREILGLFGQEYVGYAYLLTLFGLVGIIRSLNTSTLVITTCMEKNVFMFTQQFLNMLGQVALTLIFISGYGVMAIAGAKMLSVSIASLAGVFYVFFVLSNSRKLPLSYKAAVLTGAVMTIMRIWLVPTGWLPAAVLMLLCTVLFAMVSRFGFGEIRGIIRFAIRHDAGIVTEAIEHEHLIIEVQ